MFMQIILSLIFSVLIYFESTKKSLFDTLRMQSLNCAPGKTFVPQNTSNCERKLHTPSIALYVYIYIYIYIYI